MPFSISGRIAEGMDDALAQVLDRRLKEATRQQVERQNAAENLMRQQGLELQKQGLEQSAANQGLAQKRFDLEDLRYRDKQTEEATNRNRASDIAGVLAMPGMTDDAKFREASGLAVKAGSDPLKIIEGLRPAKANLQDYTYTYPSGRQEKRFFDANKPPGNIDMGGADKAPTKPEKVEPLWVSIGGKPVDLHHIAPEGSAPITASTNYQTEVKNETNQKALAAMRSYGDDMLDVIDSLIDEDDKGNVKLKADAAGVVGGVQGLWPEGWYPGETSQGALTNITHLQKMLDINQLRELKAQSRTGATGFGALSAPELAIIEGAASKLTNRRQSEAVFAEELQRIRKTLRAGRPADGGGGGGQEAPPKKETPAERLDRLLRGGNQ